VGIIFGAQHYLSILVCLNVGMCRYSCAIILGKSNLLEPHLPLATSRQASPYCRFSPNRWLPARRSRLLAQEYILSVTLKINARVLPEPCSIIFAVHFKVVPHVSFLTVMGDEIHGTCMLIVGTIDTSIALMLS
jgi:hypothetical protein